MLKISAEDNDKKKTKCVLGSERNKIRYEKKEEKRVQSIGNEPSFISNESNGYLVFYFLRILNMYEPRELTEFVLRNPHFDTNSKKQLNDCCRLLTYSTRLAHGRLISNQVTQKVSDKYWGKRGTHQILSRLRFELVYLFVFFVSFLKVLVNY